MERLEEGSLDLRVAGEELEQARARTVTAEARFNPGLSVTREQLSDEGADYHETVVSLAHTLEVGGQRGLRREAASRELVAAEAAFDAAWLQVAFEVRRAYVRAASAEAVHEALREATGVVRTIEEAGTRRLAEGDISDFELQRLRVEHARYETLLGQARLDLVQAGRELARWLAADSGRTGDVLVLAADSLILDAVSRSDLTLEAALAMARHRPDVRMAEAEVEAARAQLAVQRRERVPDLTVSGGYKEQADGFGGAVLGLSVPLPLLDRNRGRIAEAEAALRRAEAKHALALRAAESDARSAWERHRTLLERLALVNRQLLVQSADLLSTARVAYAEGEMTLVELLDAAEAHRTARQTAVELLQDAAVSGFDLERAVGGTQDLHRPGEGSR